MFGSIRTLAILLLLSFPALSQYSGDHNSPLQSSVPENLKIQPASSDNLLPRVPSRVDSSPAKPEDVVPLRPILPPLQNRFPALARAAGMIFSGTVSSVERRPGDTAEPVATVAITFHVESSFRGTTPGENLTIQQWIGAWSGGQRYRVGERVFLFLYPPSKLGLTSTVGGPMGRFNIDPAGWVLLSAHHLAAFQSDPVLGGKTRVRFSDFALAVRRASAEE